MKKRFKKLAESNPLKEPLLRSMLSISVALTGLLPLSYLFFIHPHFEELLIEDKREDAISIARHVSSSFRKTGEMNGDSLPVGLLLEVLQHKNDFGLKKLKVYSRSGAVLYSTDAKEIGRINKKKYFRETLAKREVHTAIIRKQTESLEGEIIPADVVETYVPLIRDDKLLGAFEIYYDITTRRDQIRQILYHSLGLLSGLAACVLAVILLVFHKGKKSIIARRQAEQALKEAHDTLEIKVQERTQELGQANEQLQIEMGERKRAEERIVESKAMLQSVFDGISDPLVMLDENLELKMLNKAALEYYGVGEYKEILGKPCHEAIKGDASVCNKCLVPDVFSSGGKVAFERRGLFDPDLTEEVVVYPVEEVPGKVTGCVVQVSDVTEEKRVERQMIRADRLSSLGQLSGGIAHEIRNPLSGIGLFMDVLFDEEKFERTDEELEIYREIKGNISKINMIIKRILDFARDSERVSAKIDVNPLIKESLKLWYGKMRKDEIKLELSLDENLPTVLGDAIGLQQVVNNLVQNAIEAMNGGGQLRIATRNGTSSFYEDRPMVRIEVQDTGPGITPEQQEKIFDPFFSTKPTGTGLGLAISHQIVESHGGILSFRTQLGLGTTFILELPETSEE